MADENLRDWLKQKCSDYNYFGLIDDRSVMFAFFTAPSDVPGGVSCVSLEVTTLSNQTKSTYNLSKLLIKIYIVNMNVLSSYIV